MQEAEGRRLQLTLVERLPQPLDQMADLHLGVELGIDVGVLADVLRADVLEPRAGARGPQFAQRPAIGDGDEEPLAILDLFPVLEAQVQRMPGLVVCGFEVDGPGSEPAEFGGDGPDHLGLALLVLGGEQILGATQ